MLTTPPIYFKKWLALYKILLFLIFLSINSRESYLINDSQCTISLLSNKNDTFNRLVPSNTNNLECSNKINVINLTHKLNEDRNTVNINEVESEHRIQPNILALLCSDTKQLEILIKLYNSISQNSSHLKRILYITESENKLSNIIDSFSNNGYQNKLNIIRPGLISLNNDALMTLANSLTINRYYYEWIKNAINFHNGTLLKLDGEVVTEKNSVEFNEYLNSLIGSYFMNAEELENLVHTKRPIVPLDSELLVSAKRWIDNNYVETDFILDQLRREGNKENVIVADNFRYKFVEQNILKCGFNEQILASLKSNCLFIGTTEDIYNPHHVNNWLTTLFGGVKVMTMSKSPNFKLLTPYGSLEVFTDLEETYATKFSKLDSYKTREFSKYFTKKSNLVRLTNINQEINKVIAKAIKDSLSYIGIKSYHGLIRASTKVRSLFKRYVRELRIRKDFNNAVDKLSYLLNYIIDVSNNRTLSKLVRMLNLNSIIKEKESPGLLGLLTYIKKENLYPTVIYKFDKNFLRCMNEVGTCNYINENNFGSVEEFINSNDCKDMKLELIHHSDSSKHLGFNTDLDRLNKLRLELLERGVCFVCQGDSEKYKNLLKRNLDKFKVIVSNVQVPSANHYVFLDQYLTSNKGSQAMSNSMLYTLTQGGKLVTFTMDMDYMLHNFKALVSPLYHNLSRMDLEDYEEKECSKNLTERSFGKYLKDCKALYSETSPGALEMIDPRNELKKYLSDRDLDTSRLKELKRRMGAFRAYIETIKHSLTSKCYFRSKLISEIAKRVPMTGSTVLGLDGKHYRILYKGTNPFKHLSIREEEMNRAIDNFKNDRVNYILLQEVEEGNNIITELGFIKDIVEIGGQDTLEVEPIEVENIYSYQIHPENDYKEYFSVKDIRVDCIGLNKEGEIEQPKLSSVIPGRTRDEINRNIEEYERSVKEMENMIAKSMEKEESEEKKVKKDQNSIRGACEEFVKLDKKLKNVNLEQIIREHRFKGAYFGR